MQYAKLAEIYDQLEKTPSRLEKTRILSDFFKKINEYDQIMLLLQGRVFSPGDSREIGIAQQLMLKGLILASGKDTRVVEALWKKTADLGETAQQLLTKKSQATLTSSSLTVNKVFNNLQQLATMEGQGTVDRKLKLIAELLIQATPLEAKFITRTLIGDTRTGIGEPTIRDALVWAFSEINITYKNGEISVNRAEYDKAVEKIQQAIDLTNNPGEIATILKEKGTKGLQTIKLLVGNPIKVMLFQKAKNIADGFETVGKPAAIEYKYDGFRLTIHKKKEQITLFTRRLENITKQFPDIVKLIKENAKAQECILDAEAVGVKDGKYRPFQEISQRIKRKYEIERMQKDFPIRICVFDVLEIEGKSAINLPFNERRKILATIIKENNNIQLSEQLITDNEKEAEKFYKKSLEAGNEGIMMKNLNSEYKPGSRVGFGVKVKPTMETLEVVITGAELGEGKRGKWLSSFAISVRKEDELAEIGKVGTGIKEKEEEGVSFEQLTQMLKPLITKEEGRTVTVKPKIVIEVDYEEIQASPTYSSGYALRFPRLVRLREDRGVEDIAEIKEVEKLYKEQRGRK